MGKFIDLTGNRFGKLVAIEKISRHRNNGKTRTYWRCKCDCGNEIEVAADALRKGSQISCGCYRKANCSKMFTKHNMTDTRLYYVWSSIKSRCENRNVHEYKYYGARGIKICDEWRNDFMCFYNWAIENGYDDNAERGRYTIDRIDTNGNYCPDNCRFVTQAKQMTNIRTNHNIEYNGEVHCISDWARITGIDQFKIRNRIEKLGWSPERALTTV